MQLGAITAQRLVAALGAEARTLAAEPGAELAARVVEGPNGSGQGLIALAGMRLAARLPAGVRAGDELRLVVVRSSGTELVAKIVTEHADAAAHVADAAGRLALAADGDAMRAALALAGGAPLWLPDGRAAEVAVDADAAADGGEAGTSRASFVLHCPHAGAIEVHLSMDRGGIRAGVVAPPRTADRAEAAAADLVAALEGATGRPATADVRAWPPAESPPRPPAGRIDERV